MIRGVLCRKEPALLIDKLSSNSIDDKSENKFGKELYAPHRPAEQINSGIKTGKVLQGVFYLSRTNFKEGTVSCEAYDQPVLIKGMYPKLLGKVSEIRRFVLSPSFHKLKSILSSHFPKVLKIKTEQLTATL